jgi:cyclopropane fatty-acyl-phospholipid synthase-like methyltransferase
MNPNKALWEKGDFTRIAESMRESGEALVQRIGISKGLKVLDLGCGDGTTAIPAAKLGADVLGVDIARNLVEAGNKRAKFPSTRAGILAEWRVNPPRFRAALNTVILGSEGGFPLSP